MSNALHEEIEAKGISSRAPSKWEPVKQDSVEDFPRLTMQELLRFTLGIYQIKRASWYVKQHMNENGQYQFFLHRAESGLIRVRMHSRHKSQTLYNVWVKFDATKTGLDAILGYTCECPVGLRVVGACSHVTSVRFVKMVFILLVLFFNIKLCLRLSSICLTIGTSH
jgi:hypothetical protein